MVLEKETLELEVEKWESPCLVGEEKKGGVGRSSG